LFFCFLLSALCHLIIVMSARNKKRQNLWMLFGIAAVSTLIIVGGLVYFIHPTIPTRIGVAIVGNPTIVFSYDQRRNIAISVSIPTDVSVDAVRGYGTYPISSVWKLDRMDRRKGVLFQESLEEAIGIPIRFFIDPPSNNSNVFSFASCIQLFIQRRTNIPVWLLYTLFQALPSMGPTDMTEFDLTNSPVFIETTQADGTMVKKIDTEKLTLLLGTHAEDAQIRKENLRIAVSNTTESSGLAQKLARILEGTGFHVITLANEENVRPTRCVIRSKQELKESYTVKTLQWLYGCVFEEANEELSSDVHFIIGSEFENRFVSF